MRALLSIILTTPIILKYFPENDLFFYFYFNFLIIFINALSNSGIIIANGFDNNFLENKHYLILDSIIYETSIKCVLSALLLLIGYFKYSSTEYLILIGILSQSILTNLTTTVNSLLVISGSSKSILFYDLLTALIVPLTLGFFYLFIDYNQNSILFSSVVIGISLLCIDFLHLKNHLKIRNYSVSYNNIRLGLKNSLMGFLENIYLNLDRIIFVNLFSRSDFNNYNYSKQYTNQLKVLSNNFYKPFLSEKSQDYKLINQKILIFGTLLYLLGLILIPSLTIFINSITLNKFGKAALYITFLYSNFIIKILFIPHQLKILQLKKMEKFLEYRSLFMVCSILIVILFTGYFNELLQVLFLILVLQIIDLSLNLFFGKNDVLKKQNVLIIFFYWLTYLIFWYVWNSRICVQI